MITDLVSMTMIQEWLRDNAPEYLDGWSTQMPPVIPDEIKAAVATLQTASPQMGATFLSQTCIAKAAIEKWDLTEVAMLGAGRPHIFSPSPNQVKFYTDQVPEVLEAAQADGYQTVQVDAGKPTDLEKLQGAKTVIGTGLFHFFPDEAIAGLFRGLAQIGVEAVVFNHADPAAGRGHFDASAAHVRLYPRSQDDLQAVLPEGWTLEKTISLADFIADYGDLGAKLKNQPHMSNVYMAVRK